MEGRASAELALEVSQELSPWCYAGDQVLRELPSPGKSGSVFFVSYDERYMIKTMRKVRLFPEASTFRLHSAESTVK